MNMKLFMSSIAAIAPWFALFVSKGMQTARQEPGQTLRAIRPIGLACEQAMFRATGASTPIKGGSFRLVCFVLPPGVCKAKAKRSIAARSAVK
jgi:triphosphoribosyl-dephospho-CoA synthase